MDNFFSSPRLFDDLDRCKIRHALWLWSKANEIEKGWHKGQDQGEFDHINLDGQTRSLHAGQHGPTTSRRKFLWRQQLPRETSHCRLVKLAHGLQWQFSSYRQQLFDESTYLQVDHEIVFPPSGPNSTQQLDTVIFTWGWIYPPRFQAPSGEEFDWRSWKGQDCPTLRLVGRPSAAATNVVRLESRHNQHWPGKSSTQLCCHLCPSHGKEKGHSV